MADSILSEARALRALATDLMRQRPVTQASTVTAPQRIDLLLREGSDPARLEAEYAALDRALKATKQHKAQLEALADSFTTLYPKLEAAFASAPTETIHHVLLSGELRQCAGVMATLLTHMHQAALDAGAAAAMAVSPRIIAPAKDRRSSGGIILPAA